MPDIAPTPGSVRRDDLLATLPPIWPHDPLPAIRDTLRKTGEKIIVLDDDPTGSQTVYDLPILTQWSPQLLREEFGNDSQACFVLTNSRAMPEAQACDLSRRMGQAIRAAAKGAARRVTVISRSDSTLRGHYPAEVDAVAEGLGDALDITLLAPAFFAGGRYTIGDTHYVAEGDWLLPAGETAYAHDAAFGYRASNLRQWVQEKSRGRVRAGQVASISLSAIREGGPNHVAGLLSALPRGVACVINAADERDLEVAALGAMMAGAAGRRIIYRTAATFVRAYAGLPPHPLLRGSDLDTSQGSGGLIVVGSYVPKTSQQVAQLLGQANVAGIEVNVESLLDARRGETIAHVAAHADAALADDADVVLYTSRQLIRGEDGESSLALGRRVSDALVEIVHAIGNRPRYMIAKGGITSSDLATAGLGMRRAMVAGQILPGVPVWTVGDEGRWPGLTYIVFPGNVGNERALADAVAALRQNLGHNAGRNSSNR